jgi:hypothetical protein
MRAQSIKSNEYFSPGRFFLLLKRDFLFHYRTIIIAAAAIAGFSILTSALSAIMHSGENFHVTLYFILLYIGGFMVSSRAFREIHNSQKSYTYVTLPGSPFEKYTERLISTSIGYALGTFAIYFIIAVISERLNLMLFGYTHALLNPLNRAFLMSVAAFIVIQGFFLAGSVFFKKNSFIKTILTFTLFAITLLVIAILAARLIVPGYFEGLRPVKQDFHTLGELAEWLGMTEGKLELVGRTIWLVIRILFWTVLAPLCWVVSYLKFRKIEV